MTIGDLLERWAVWHSARTENRLGYAEGALNRLMSGAVNTGGACPSSLPYGVDTDSVFTLVDSAVMRLPRFHRKAIKVHYSDGFNNRRTEATECGCGGALLYRYLSGMKAMLTVSLRDSEASRLLSDFQRRLTILGLKCLNYERLRLRSFRADVPQFFFYRFILFQRPSDVQAVLAFGGLIPCIVVDLGDVFAHLDDVTRRQIPFTAKNTVNKLAANVIEAEQTEMASIFDNPRQWTLNNPFVRRYTDKHNLTTIVDFKSSASNRSAGKYL